MNTITRSEDNPSTKPAMEGVSSFIIPLPYGGKRAARSILHRESYFALRRARKDTIMLWTIAVVLVILWLLGLITSYTLGGFIHILLVVAIIVILVNVISGRKGTA
jgi:hypothetical protein